jgi:hypothetical protein
VNGSCHIYPPWPFAVTILSAGTARFVSGSIAKRLRKSSELLLIERLFNADGSILPVVLKIKEAQKTSLILRDNG